MGLLVVRYFDGRPLVGGAFKRLVALSSPEPLTEEALTRQEIVARDSVVLGYQPSAVATADEASHAAVSGSVAVVIDGNVHNWKDLRSRGGCRDLQRADAALIAEAVEQEGLRVLDDLIGEFTLAVWLVDEQRLAISCGPSGRRYLFYAYDSAGFFAATRPHPLFESSRSGASLSSVMMLEYLSGIVISKGSTFFEEVHLISPGEVIVCDDKGRTQRSERVATSLPCDASIDEAAEVLRALFREAVRVRTDSTQRINVLLSGGLDSSAVACMAASLSPPGSLRLVSAVFEELAECDEREYIREVQRVTGLENVRVRADGYWPLRHESVYKDVLPYGPGLDVTLALSKACCEVAADHGPTMLLTGEGAETIGGSRLRYSELLRSGNVMGAIWELLRDPMPSWRVVLRYWIIPHLPQWVFGLAAATEGSELVFPKWLNRKAIDRANFRDRVKQVFASASVTSPPGCPPEGAIVRSSVAALETAAQEDSALSCGAQLAHPFLDARVSHYAYSVDSGFRFRQGKDKYLIRRAMEGLVPSKILKRTTVGRIDALVHRGLQREKARVLTLMENSRLAQLGFVDQREANRRIEEYYGEHRLWHGGDKYLIEVWRLVAAEIWLRWAEGQPGIRVGN